MELVSLRSRSYLEDGIYIHISNRLPQRKWQLRYAYRIRQGVFAILHKLELEGKYAVATENRMYLFGADDEIAIGICNR